MIQQLEASLPIRHLKPQGSKVARATSAATFMEQGKVWFPKGKPWLDELYAELAMFPYAKHDDQVDVLSYAARQITQRERVRWAGRLDPDLRKPSGFGP